MQIFAWNGTPLKLDKVDSNFLHWYPFAEIQTRYILNSILPFDAVVIDIGANVGVITCELAQRARHRTIYALEGSTKHTESLMFNVKQLGLKNVVIKNIFLSNSTKQKSVEFWESNNIIKQKILIKQVRLDDFLSRENPGRLDLVKIDTDGNELKILLGSLNLLKTQESIWLIEEAYKTKLYKKLMIQGIMSFHGYRRVAKLDIENVLWAKKNQINKLRNDISLALNIDRKIDFATQSIHRRTIPFEKSMARVDVNAPRGLKIFNTGFKYKSRRPHSNLFLLETSIQNCDTSAIIPLRVLSGTINLVVTNMNSGEYYVREVYPGEERLELPLKGAIGDQMTITFRSGLMKKGKVAWESLPNGR